MDPWFLITQFGWPEGWAYLSAGLVLTYLILIHTHWKEHSQKRKSFKSVTVLLALSLVLTFVVVQSVKETARVPRPCTPCTSPEMSACNPYCIEDDYSLPSGHAATIFAVSTVAILLLKRRIALLLYILAILVAYSRVALGVHTLPDIALGAFIGLTSAAIIWKIRPKLPLFS